LTFDERSKVTVKIFDTDTQREGEVERKRGEREWGKRKRRIEGRVGQKE
jgi:hypothetical protein